MIDSRERHKWTMTRLWIEVGGAAEKKVQTSAHSRAALMPNGGDSMC
jgi:hypothetical protein